MADIPETIEAIAKQPAKVQVDGMIVESQDISKMIEADRYLEQKKAAKSRQIPILIGKIRPPGAV